MFVDIFNTDKKYKIILIDAPWTFKTYSDKGKSRSPENHYKCETLEDIKKLPIKNLADKDAVLFHWVTFPLLREGLDVMKAWGFEYRTCAFNWIKTTKNADLAKLNVAKDIRMNLGYFTRSNSELCLTGEALEDEQTDLVLLGRKGKTLERKSMGVRQVIITPMQEHSRKPVEVHERIEALYGKDISKIEIFGRQEREGWDIFGDEYRKFNDQNK